MLLGVLFLISAIKPSAKPHHETVVSLVYTVTTYTFKAINPSSDVRKKIRSILLVLMRNVPLEPGWLTFYEYW